MADDLNNIEAEIAQMQKTEDGLEYALAVQQIINAHNTAKTFISHLPPEIKSFIKDNNLIDDLYLRKNGFVLGDTNIIIEQNDFLVIKKGSVAIEEKSFVINSAKKIKNLAAKFQNQMKQKIAEEKERLMEELKKF